MTNEQPADDDDVATEEEFERALGRLLRTASDNGVDPRGGYVYRDREDPDLEVVVVRLDDDEAGVE